MVLKPAGRGVFLSILSQDFSGRTRQPIRIPPPATRTPDLGETVNRGLQRGSLHTSLGASEHRVLGEPEKAKAPGRGCTLLLGVSWLHMQGGWEAGTRFQVFVPVLADVERTACLDGCEGGEICRPSVTA